MRVLVIGNVRSDDDILKQNKIGQKTGYDER